MSYSKLYLKKGRKFISILGLLSLISFLVGAILFVSELGKKNGWQHIEGIDKIYIVNRSAQGFEVIWSTKKISPDSQWVEVGRTKGNFPIKSNAELISGVYRAVINGLEANTHYYFRIRSGPRTYILPSLTSDTIQTPRDTNEKPISPAYGKVTLPSTKPYAQGLLIYEVEGFYPIAVFTKQTGEWLLPLTGLIEKKSNAARSVSDASTVLIKLFSFPQGTIRTSVGKTRPLRQAIIAGNTIHLAQAVIKNEESILGATTQSTSAENTITTRIIYPKENAVIPGKAPLIRGTAPVGRNITVLIQGGTKQYSYRTVADDKGDWVVQSPFAMEFGRYTITVTIQNGRGATTVVQRNFTIIKSGEQVLGEATGSPTLVPTEVVPTYANPTISTPSPVPTLLLPTALIPTRFVPTAEPPVTGGGMSSYLFGAIFFIVVGAGLVLAF